MRVGCGCGCGGIGRGEGMGARDGCAGVGREVVLRSFGIGRMESIVLFDINTVLQIVMNVLDIIMFCK